MKLKIYGELIIKVESPEIILLAVDPENKLLPKEYGTIISEKTPNSVKTTINGEMSLGAFINTIDDLFKAVMLALDIITEIED